MRVPGVLFVGSFDDSIVAVRQVTFGDRDRV